MKKIILFILFLLLMSCATITFKDVCTPFIEKYGNPTDTELYQASRYTFRTWTWWDKKIKVTFIREEESVPFSSVWNWRVYSIYKW